MSKLRLITAALMAASLAVGTTVAFAGTKTIKIGDNWFVSPTKNNTTVKISKNSRIKWKWSGSDEHNVRLKSAPSGVTKSKFTISERSTGTKRTSKLTKPGLYKFICSIHDYDNQIVKVRVKAN